MRHLAYPHLALPPSLISESSDLEEHPFNPGQLDWTDDEIRTIRLALKKLTAIRIFDSNDAEDLVQETLLTMISKQPGAVLEKGPLAWGLGILRKKVGNYYRKVRRYSPLNEQEAEDPQRMRIESPEMMLFERELNAIVNEILSQLPASQRQALELSIAGFNAGEIAEQLHPRPYQNVVNCLFRGRRKVARELAKYGYARDEIIGMGQMKKSRGGNRALKCEMRKAAKRL